jgi:hypothetical protein
LLAGGGEDVTQRGPEPERSVADGEHWRSHAAALAVPEQVGPRLRRLAVPIGERDQLFGTVGTHADHHQQADLVLLQADLKVDPVDPQVHVVGVGQGPLVERGRLVLPVLGQPGDRRGRESVADPEELGQRRGEVRGRQAVQVQQRQHLRDPRGLPSPRGQNRRAEPLPLACCLIDTLVVDPRCPHRDRARRRRHLPLGMEAITDHQPPTVLVELVLELLDVGGDLGLQRRGQHLPSTIAHDLIKKRPTGRLVGRLDVVDYLEHERTFPNHRANAVLIRFQLLRDPPREDALLRLHPPTTIHRF